MQDLSSRYSRNHLAISLEEQKRLESSNVVVIGCGGLGGYIAEQLARLGIGSLTLIDGDVIEPSNLNRQIMATEENIGRVKVEAALERLKVVNSEIRVQAISEWFTEEKGLEWLQGVDLVWDALDSRETRVMLERVCHKLNIPLVYASVAGWYGLFGVSCPGDYTVRRLFGQGQAGVEKTLGNPAFAPAVLASLAVTEGLKLLIGRPLSLRKAWCQVDLLEMEFERFNLI